MKIPMTVFAPFTLELETGFRDENDSPADGFAPPAPDAPPVPQAALGNAGFAAFMARLATPEMFMVPLPAGVLQSVHALPAAPETAGPKPVADTGGLVIAAAPPAGLTQAQVDALETGLDQALAGIQSNLMAQVFAESLPIIGDNLLAAAGGGAAQLGYVTTLKTAVVNGLATLTGSAMYTEAQVESAINSALSGAGISGAGADLDLSNMADAKLNFTTAKAFGGLSVPIEGDLGLPNLGFTTSGNVQNALSYTLNFTAGLDGAGFYVNSAPGSSTFNISGATTAPGFASTAVLGALPFNAQNDAASPTSFTGIFSVALKDGDADGRLRTSELSGDVLDATLSGNGALHLKLASNLPSSASLMQVGTTLDVTYNFLNAVVNPADDNSTFGSAPSVAFRDNSYNLASFFNNFASDMLGEITTITAPLQPIIEVLTAEIPILSDLGSKKVTLLDFAGVTEEQAAAIEGLSDIIDIADLIAGYTNNGSVNIDLGSVSVTGDVRTQTPDELGVTVTRTPPSPGSQHTQLGEFLTAVNNVGGGGLAFPFITDVLGAGKMLLGKNVDLFSYKPPTLGFDFQFAQFFPVLGPIGVKLGGHFGMDMTLAFGFDTQGIRDFTGSGGTDATKVFNGFYVQAFDENFEPVTSAAISAGVIAGIQANIGFANAGVDGDLTATVRFAFDQSLADDAGKVRGIDLLATPLDDLFDVSGELSTGLRAYLEIGISPFSIEFSFESPRVILITFDGSNANPPVLAQFAPDGTTLELNVGANAPRRLLGNLSDRSENYFVDAVTDGVFVHTRVKAFGHTVTCGDGSDLPSRITGAGLEKSDKLEVASYLPVPVTFSGGPNRDVLTGGAMGDQLFGDDGPDILSGNGGNDELRGGEGADKLIGGADADIIDGGAGEDTASHATAAAGMTINLQTNTFTGDAVGDTFIGIERYEGTNFDDDITGDNGFQGLLGGLGGNDTIRGLGSDDLLDGGNGNDTLEGGAGNDFLVGGPGGDTLNGGDGSDTIAYTSSKAGVTVSLLTGMGAGGDAQGDVLIDLEILYGSPLPFGDVLDISYPLATGDWLEGNNLANVISGLGGADTIYGLGGDDILWGEAAIATGDQPVPGFDNDRLYGGDGSDILYGQADDDVLDGGDGNDTLDGAGGIDHLIMLDAAGIDHADAGPDFDALSANFSTQTVDIAWDDRTPAPFSFADGRSASNFETLVTIFTGSGNDSLYLASNLPAGIATTFYTFYTNTISTGAGNDTVYSGKSNDVIDTGTGNDVVFAGPDNDTVNAGDDDDFVNGGSNGAQGVFDAFGALIGYISPGDALHGGLGNDWISFDEIDFTIPVGVLGAGTRLGVYVDLAINQTGYGAIGMTISGFENIRGTNFADDLRGDAGPNIFEPLRGGGPSSGSTSGPDHIDGAGGEDILRIDFSLADLPNAQGVYTNSYTIYRNTIGNTAVVDSYLYANVERLQITGASKDDLLYSWAAGDHDDTLIGLGGNDTLGGKSGSDTLLGGDGSDIISGQGTFTFGYEGSAGGHDVFDGGAGDDWIEDIAYYFGTPSLAAGALFQLDGGSGFDILSVDFSNQTAAITWDSATPTNVEFADGAYARNFEQIRRIVSGPGNDAITQRGRVDNNFHLGAGNDTVNPGLGLDTLDGQDGNDLAILDFSVGDTAEMGGVQGGGNPDGGTWFRALAADFFNRPDVVSIRNVERVWITGTSKHDSIAGTYGDDVLTGGDGNDVLDGNFGGNNVLDGGAGDDSLKGSYGIYGTGRNDTLSGGDGNDTLNGLNGDDTFFGGAGNDTIIVHDAAYLGSVDVGGQDFVEAGPGDDTVTDIYVNSSYSYVLAGSKLRFDGGADFDTLSADFGFITAPFVFSSASPTSTDFPDGSYIRNFEALGAFISGAGHDSIVQLGRVNNSFSLGAGNDSVNAGLGLDYLFGDLGDDLLILDFSVGDDANLSGLNYFGAFYGRRDINTFAVIDGIAGDGFDRYDITGTSKTDYLPGSNGADLLRGGAGSDTIDAGFGDDLLDGGAGADTMTGGAGNDAYLVDDPGDVVNEGADGGYDAVRYDVGGLLSQPANVEKITFTESATLPALNIGANGIAILGGGSPAPALPAAASALNAIARWQALAGAPLVPIQADPAVASLAKITAGALHDTPMRVAPTEPAAAFPDRFAPEFTADADLAHDAWHDVADPVRLDFGALDALV
jgi:Ca2+-binding RTX toxin-like protein